MRPLLLLLLTLSVFAAGGCNSARYVYLDGTGGVIAMPYNTEGNRAEATKLMRAHCPNGFEIVREQEVAIGSTTTTSTGTEPTQSGGVVAGTTISTRTDTEWQIVFRCRAR
ncbi:MAG: hypothetical protein IT345_12050 [Trueperaceae bacterium]|nr:hypothetical protein [Trueperaceae bacterium]